MKRFLIGTALASLGLAPTIGSACDYNDASSASATPPARITKASPLLVTKVPAQVVAKATVLKPVKQVGDKSTSPPQDAKVARVATTN